MWSTQSTDICLQRNQRVSLCTSLACPCWIGGLRVLQPYIRRLKHYINLYWFAGYCRIVDPFQDEPGTRGWGCVRCSSTWEHTSASELHRLLRRCLSGRPQGHLGRCWDGPEVGSGVRRTVGGDAQRPKPQWNKRWLFGVWVCRHCHTGSPYSHWWRLLSSGASQREPSSSCNCYNVIRFLPGCGQLSRSND